ncbi:MAG: hypothetical protein AAGE01_18715 [Pseudomonadota bacterium]
MVARDVDGDVLSTNGALARLAALAHADPRETPDRAGRGGRIAPALSPLCAAVDRGQFEVCGLVRSQRDGDAVLHHVRPEGVHQRIGRPLGGRAGHATQRLPHPLGLAIIEAIDP